MVELEFGPPCSRSAHPKGELRFGGVKRLGEANGPGGERTQRAETREKNGCGEVGRAGEMSVAESVRGKVERAGVFNGTPYGVRRPMAASEPRSTASTLTSTRSGGEGGLEIW